MHSEHWRAAASIAMAALACKRTDAPAPPPPAPAISVASATAALSASASATPTNVVAHLEARPSAKNRAQVALVAKEVGLDEKIAEISDPWACAASTLADRVEISCTPFPRTPLLTLRVVGDDLVLEKSGKQVGITPLAGRRFEVDPLHAGPRQLVACDPAIQPKPQTIELQTFTELITPHRTSDINLVAGGKLVQIGQADTDEPCAMNGDRIECNRETVCRIDVEDDEIAWECAKIRGLVYAPCDAKPMLPTGKIKQRAHYH